jgi:NitT/TauT family transport system substrate-binding protein
MKKWVSSSVLAFAALVAVGISTASAAEKLKVAIPQRGFWDSSWVEFGEAAGFFKEAGLEVEVFYTDGGAQTIATVASGSVDIAMSNGILGAIGAYVKGGDATPYRIISAEMTGAHELFWWVKADSAIKSLKDAGEGKTIAFSSPGSSSNLILLTLLKQAGSKAKPTPTGGVPATFTQTMTGQIDIGWSVVPFALKDVNDGKIRIVARAREAADLQNQTIRANLANTNSLKTKRETIAKFMRVIHKSIDWGYSNPQAIEIFARNMKVTPDIAKQAVTEYYPKSAMQLGEIRDLERSLQDALEYKFIPAAKTPKDIAGLIDIVYKP